MVLLILFAFGLVTILNFGNRLERGRSLVLEAKMILGRPHLRLFFLLKLLQQKKRYEQNLGVE